MREISKCRRDVAPHQVKILVQPEGRDGGIVCNQRRVVCTEERDEELFGERKEKGRESIGKALLRKGSISMEKT